MSKNLLNWSFLVCLLAILQFANHSAIGDDCVPVDCPSPYSFCVDLEGGGLECTWLTGPAKDCKCIDFPSYIAPHCDDGWFAAWPIDGPKAYGNSLSTVCPDMGTCFILGYGRCQWHVSCTGVVPTTGCPPPGGDEICGSFVWSDSYENAHWITDEECCYCAN